MFVVLAMLANVLIHFFILISYIVGGGCGHECGFVRNSSIIRCVVQFFVFFVI